MRSLRQILQRQPADPPELNQPGLIPAITVGRIAFGNPVPQLAVVEQKTEEKQMAKKKVTFEPGQAVIVDHCGEPETTGNVETVQANGKVDIRIYHVGHKENGRIVTFNPEDVSPAPAGKAEETA